MAELQNFFRRFLPGLCLLATLARLSGQSTDTWQTVPPRGTTPLGFYSISQIENISATTGSVSLRIPIASLPAGRAGWTTGLNLVYNSSIYTEVTGTGISTVNPGTPALFGYLNSSGFGGWQYEYNYSLGLETPAAYNVCAPPTNGKIFKLSLYLPDGSSHALHLLGQFDNDGDAYYSIDPAGNSNGIPGCTSTAATSDLTYYTSDGTYLTVVVHHVAGSQYWSNNPWTIYFPDGRTVTGAGADTTSIADRNGNTINVQNFFSIDNSNPVNVLTDAVGRTIQIEHLNGQPGQDVITQIGYGETPGTPNTWTVNWTTVTLSGSLQYVCSDYEDLCSGQGLSQYVVQSIVLPTGLQYQFNYNNVSGGWGELSSMTLPSSANVQYAFLGYSGSYGVQLLTLDPVSTKTVTWSDEDDSPATQRTEVSNYSFTTTSSTFTNPDGGQTAHSFYDLTIPSNSLTGLVYKVVQPDGSTLQRMWWQNRPYGSQGIDPANPYVKEEFQSMGGTQASAVIYTIDKNGNQTQVSKTDCIASACSITHDQFNAPSGYSGGSAVSSTTNTYSITTANAGNGTENIVDDPNAYWHAHTPQLLDLLTQSVVQDQTGVGAPGMATGFSYDGNGNVLHELQWDSVKGGFTSPLTSSNAAVINHTYDAYGNLLTTQNARGYTTQYTYDATYSLSVTEMQQAIEDSANTRTFTYVHDNSSAPPPTDLLISQTDSDHSVTHGYGYDPYGRKNFANDAGLMYTNLNYADASRRIITYADVTSANDQQNQSAVWYDQLGRVRLTNQMQNAGDNPTSPTAGIQVQTRYLTPQNAGVSYQLISNPYVTGSETTAGWTLKTLDTMGRVTAVQHFTGQALPATGWGGGNTTSTGTSTFSYSGNCTTATDEAGVWRRSCVDGFGRMKTVFENGINGTTTYTYDALGNLWSVTPPAGNGRSFVYSSLSRLIGAANPESGTETYAYDNNGNLATRTDARGIQTVSSYNGLDQLTGKTYSDSTPPSSYTYSRGWLTGTSADTTVFTYGNFDGLGRPQAVSQNMNGINYPFSAAYAASGPLSTVTFPSGRAVNTTYDRAGRVSGLGGAMGGQTTNYAGLIGYAPQGAIGSMITGDQVMHATAYNARLQTTSINATLQGTTLFSLSLGYSPTANNGNLVSETIGRPGLSAAQTFSYTDGMNRLNGASESGAWSDTYVYDCASNRAVTGNSSSTQLVSNYTPQTASSSSCVIGSSSPSVPYDGNNRWTAAGYDAAGDMTAVSTQSMQYDAERRLIQLTDTSTNPATTVTYGYDADGRRVSKTNSAVTTTYVYGPDGALAAEYSAGPANIGGTEYLTTDQLGSTRLVTNAAGTAIGCHDYLPFGQEIPGTWGSRSASCYSQAGDTTIKFTGQERDSDTTAGLDYFGARYNSSAQGRFTSPDPIFVTAHRVSDPQQWNLYAYSRNNPLRFTDPTGLDIWLQGCGDESDTCHKGYVGSYNDSGKFDRTHLSGDQTDSASLGTTGVSVNYNGGTYQGVWDTNKNEQNAVTVDGSGALSDFTFTVNGNCGGTCQVSGIVNGTNTASGLQSLQFAVTSPGSGFLQNPGFYGADPFHVGRTNFLGYDPNQPQGLAATHLPVPGSVLIDPRTGQPTNVDFHVDQRYPFEDATGFANHVGSIGHTLFNDVRSVFTGLVDHGGK